MAGADMAADDKVDRIVFATQTECAVCPNVFFRAWASLLSDLKPWIVESLITRHSGLGSRSSKPRSRG